MATCLDYIFIDKNNSHLISEVSTHFGNSDHLLVRCTLRFNQDSSQSSIWRFNKDSFKNELLKKEVIEEIQDTNSAENWDWYKIYIQSIIRAFRKPKPQKTR